MKQVLALCRYNMILEIYFLQNWRLGIGISRIGLGFRLIRLIISNLQRFFGLIFSWVRYFVTVSSSSISWTRSRVTVYLETYHLMEIVHHHLVFAFPLPLLPYHGVRTNFLRNSRFKSRARSLVFQPRTQELTNSVGVWIFCQNLVWLRKTGAGRFYGFGFIISDCKSVFIYKGCFVTVTEAWGKKLLNRNQGWGLL